MSGPQTDFLKISESNSPAISSAIWSLEASRRALQRWRTGLRASLSRIARRSRQPCRTRHPLYGAVLASVWRENCGSASDLGKADRRVAATSAQALSGN